MSEVPASPQQRRRSSASNQVKPKSILRNAPPSATYSTSPGTSPLIDTSETFDRQAVLENTRQNAKLNNIGAEIKRRNTLEPGDEFLKEIQDSNLTAEEKEHQRQEHLKWDEANLYLTEQEKASTMKITEPKTPFQGAVGESEYYLPDEEDDVVKTRDNRILSVDELDGFSLGEPISTPSNAPPPENDRIVVDQTANDSSSSSSEEEEEEEELTPEERHKRFEELRKSHYYMKGAVLHSPVRDNLDVDEDDDE